MIASLNGIRFSIASSAGSGHANAQLAPQFIKIYVQKWFARH
jgi:hypothetical protein